MTMPKSKKREELEQQNGELLLDLQRTRADFENYRKRVEGEKQAAREAGQAGAILKLLPTIDNIERATTHVPPELAGNTWAQGVAKLARSLDKTLGDLKLTRIEAGLGTPFNPELHEAIQFDDEAKGEHEVIAEVLQTGYLLDGRPLRHAMVKVTRK